MTKRKSKTSTTAASAPTRQGHAAEAETAVQRSKPARGQRPQRRLWPRRRPRRRRNAVRTTAQGKGQAVSRVPSTPPPRFWKKPANR